MTSLEFDISLDFQSHKGSQIDELQIALNPFCPLMSINASDSFGPTDNIKNLQH